MTQRKALGKGLSALIPSKEGVGGLQEIPIDQIQPNPSQPRQVFDEEALEELVQSVREKGILQPLIVRPVGEKYEIVAGERRWRAARKAGLTKVPAVIRELDDGEAMQIALIENLQRQDLNPIEEAIGFKRLMDEFNLTQEKVSAAVGKSRPAIANQLRLLHLDPLIQESLAENRISVGHARALLGLKTPREQIRGWEKVMARDLTVRETEIMVRDWDMETPSPVKRPKDPNLVDVEERICQALGTKVQIQPGRKKSVIEIEYYGSEDLERILQRLGIDE